MICSGLLYGKDFPSQEIYEILSKAYNGENPVCYGAGNNFIPMVHIDTLTEFVGAYLSLNWLELQK